MFFYTAGIELHEIEMALLIISAIFTNPVTNSVRAILGGPRHDARGALRQAPGIARRGGFSDEPREGHASWHRYFGPGNPDSVKSGRIFKIVWRPP